MKPINATRAILVTLFIMAVTVVSGRPLTRRAYVVQTGVELLSRQIQHNEANSRLGRTHQNRYVIALDDPRAGEFIEERGSGNPVVHPPQFTQLNDKLVHFHETYASDLEAALYVLIINNYQVSFGKSVPSDFTLNTWSDLRTHTVQRERARVDAMVEELKTVPEEILQRLRDKGFNRAAYVYVYARIGATDLHVQTAQATEEPVLKKRTFITQVFSGNAEAHRQTQFKPTVWDLATLLQRGVDTHFGRIGANIDQFTTTYLNTFRHARRKHEAVAHGISDGPGQDLFVNLPEQVSLEGKQLESFVELCIWLSDVTSGVNYAFFHEGAEEDRPSGIGQKTLDYIYSHRLLDRASFDAHFFENFSADFPIIFSHVDLREGIPEDYNTFSIDWTSFDVGPVSTVAELRAHLDTFEQAIRDARNDGDPASTLEAAAYERIERYISECRANAERYVAEYRLSLPQTIRAVYVLLGFFEPYEYTFSDLRKRQELKSTSEIFFRAIVGFESSGQAEAITTHTGYQQYTAQYHTNKAFFLGQEFDGLISMINMVLTGQHVASQVSSLKNAFVVAKRMRGARMRQTGAKQEEQIVDGISDLLKLSGERAEVLKNARALPGIATGNGKVIEGKWLRGTEGNAGPFPNSIANKLRGKSFKNFDEFRNAFWKEVAEDPHLSQQFEQGQLSRMKQGMAPFVKNSQKVGGQRTYVLHHQIPIARGGSVYSVDNLYIVTPRFHKEILDPSYHYGYGY